MDLKHLNDETLLKDLKQFANQERTLLTQVLYHLKELDSRKLYSSLGYKSLYEYACIELKYSADQAYRRIQAMKLLKEIPEISKKIDSGALSLSNISQAQRLFNEAKSYNSSFNQRKKIEVLKSLENQSVRQAQIKILELSPSKPLPPETKKQVTPTQVQVNFLMSEELERKLEDVRSLLGTKSQCSLAELVELMAEMSVEKLKEKKFGKKRVSNGTSYKAHSKQTLANPTSSFDKTSTFDKASSFDQPSSFDLTSPFDHISSSARTPSSPRSPAAKISLRQTCSENLDVKKTSARYLSATLKYQVWQRDQGQCVKCKSKRHLNFDHIQPLALGGGGSLENLRVLCFPCNQRQRIEAKL